MSIKYYSREWAETLAAKMADQDFRKRIESLQGIIVFRIYDAPCGLDRTTHWEFNNGTLTQWTYEEKPVPWSDLRDAKFNPNWAVRISCPYAMLAKINRGEMSPMRALTSSDYQIEGKKVQILRMVSAMAAWNELAASISVEYE